MWDRIRQVVTDDPEETWLLERYRVDFVKAGADLGVGEQARLRELNTELDGLSTEFGRNVVRATNESSLVTDDVTELAELDKTRLDAIEKDGTYVLPLLNTTVQPAPARLTNRATRKHLHGLSIERASENLEIAMRMATLRAERAKLLGYADHAASLLYGVMVTERPDLRGHHADIRTWEVFDRDGSPLGLFLLDPYARPTKQGGAWMHNLVDQSFLLDQRPVVVNNPNITTPASGPALLTFDEVETAFHEFGHALHGLLSAVRFPMVEGTSVPRDFVEFPSQVNEMWALWPEILSAYAKPRDRGAGTRPGAAHRRSGRQPDGPRVVHRLRRSSSRPAQLRTVDALRRRRALTVRRLGDSGPCRGREPTAGGRYIPHDQELTALVADLHNRSPEFSRWWDEHPFYQRTHGAKRLRHPIVENLTVDYETLVPPGDPATTVVRIHRRTRLTVRASPESARELLPGGERTTASNAPG